MNVKKMNKGLDFLRDKYGARKGEITVKDGHCFVGATPLMPQRVERKIVELKKMIDGGTLEGVSTLRFASFAPKGANVEAILARELDVAAFLGAAKVVRVMAVANGPAVNALVKLANDVNCSVEVICARGVGSDQTIDTHTPHASIRVSGAKGMQEFTDVDTELFGMTYEEIWNVRAAFALLQNPALAKEWKAAYAAAAKAAAACLKADAAKAAQNL